MAGIVLAEGVVEVTADTTGVPRQIAKDLDDGNGQVAAAGGRAGKSLFGSLIGAGAVLGGAKLVGDFLGGAISGASDLAETSSKASTIFGQNMGAISSWADDAAKNMGLSKSAALEAAAGFGNMFSQIGFTNDTAARFSQRVVQMSADLGSFNNLPTADVSDRISAALRGEYDSLQALIPNINAARVEQEAMAASGRTNASELTAQEKAAAVLSIVQQDGAAAMGDYAKTADGAANTQKTLTASLEEQQAKLGTTLMPAWQGFLGFISDTAIPVLTSVVDWIGQNASWLGPLALGLGIVTAAFVVLNLVMALNPFVLVVMAIGLLVGALIWVATQTTFFQDAWRVAGEVVTNVFSFIGTVANWLWVNVLAPIFGFVVAYIGVWVAVFQFVGGVIGNVINGVGAAFQWVWNNAVSPVINWLTAAFTNVGNAVRDVFGGISSFIQGVFRNIVGFIKGPINTVIGFINQAITGANIVGGAFGVNISKIPLLAKGGNVVGGGTVVVGERGPELLNLPRGASVVPLTSGQRSQGSSGGDISVTVNEARDPLGSAGRVATELRRWRG